LGFVVVIGFEAFTMHPDPITAICLVLLAACDGGVFKLAYRKTTGKGGK
jgi:hypothetical protein